jgi:hypothetical protein
MRCRSVITQLLLLFALLAGQQIALVHAISHLATSHLAVSHLHHEEPAGTKEDPELPHGKLCVECLLSSHLVHALPSSVTLALAPAALVPKALPVRVGYVAAVALAFHSRAPPAPL